MRFRKYGRLVISNRSSWLGIPLILGSLLLGVASQPEQPTLIEARIVSGKYVRIITVENEQLVSIAPEFLYYSHPGLEKELGAIRCSPVQFYSRESLKEGVALSYISPADDSAVILDKSTYVALPRSFFSPEEKSKHSNGMLDTRISIVVYRCYFSKDPGSRESPHMKSFFFVTLDLEKGTLTCGGPFKKQDCTVAVMGARANIQALVKKGS